MIMNDKQTLFYGWIVLAACSAVSFCWGIFFSYGVFLKPIAADLGQGRGVISSAFSVFMVVSSVSAIFMGRLTDKHGTKLPLLISGLLISIGLVLCSQIQSVRQLYLFYGIISLGAGIVFTLPPATVQRWFVKKRGIALGIMSAGTGIGALVLAPLISHLIVLYGWRISFAILGVFVFITFMAAALIIFPNPEIKNLRPYGEDPSSPSKKDVAGINSRWNIRELFQTKTFWLTNIICFFSILPTYLVAIHIDAFATDIGFSEKVAAFIFGLIFGVSIPGRIMGGIIAERIGWKKGIQVCCIVCTIILIWITVVKGSGLYLFAIIYGFFFGSRASILIGLIGSLFGMRFLAGIMGIINISGFLGGAAGSSLAGFIFDNTGSYNTAFLVGALSWIIAGIATHFVRPLQ
jgi:MFS family permease